jgi:tRNA nucleotidyltransferase/poly(A) polymerase
VATLSDDLMDELFTRLKQSLLNQIIPLLPHHVPIYLVGGAIRDGLLNRPNYDLDFVTPGDAMVIARHLANELGAAYYPLDTERNIARLIIKPDDQQVVSNGRSFQVDFSAFQGASLLDDLQGRDFTINAMAMDVHNLQELIDPLGGAADLVSKHLKACSRNSFLNDPVRILRAVRFAVDLGLNIHPDTLLYIQQSVDMLPNVSTERLRDELFRILLQSHPSTSLRILDRLKALDYVLPEMSLLKSVTQSPPHVLDVWEHTLELIKRLEDLLEILSTQYDAERVSNLSSGLLVLRLGRFREQLMVHLDQSLNPDRPHRGLLFLAGLFHDTGKPRTKTIDETGKIRFIEHEQFGSRLVEQRGVALRLSNLEIGRLVKIVSHHMRPSLLSHDNEIPSRKAVYRFFRTTGGAGVDICLLSLADLQATYGPTLPQERWVQHLDVVRILLSAWWEDREASVIPTPLINGDQLMEALILSPGPQVGYLLESIREAQVGGEIKTRDEAIDFARSLLRTN